MSLCNFKTTDRGDGTYAHHCPVCNQTFVTRRPGMAKECGQRGQPCRHRLNQTGAVACPTCNGNVRIKTFGCEIHGECTLGNPVGDTPCCGTCGSYERILN